MFVVGIPILLSSLAGSYYYYSSSSPLSLLSNKLPQSLQEEIKKGRIEVNECEQKKNENENIIKSNINFKVYNLKKSKININQRYSVLNAINKGKFILNKTISFIKPEVEHIELQLFYSNVEKYPIKDSSEDPDPKQLYLKEKLIKNFANLYLTYKMKKMRSKNEVISSALNRLNKCLEDHKIKIKNIKDKKNIKYNNDLKEKNKNIKYYGKLDRRNKNNLNQPYKFNSNYKLKNSI